MALQFRAFFPYTLSGVLAIIGWWWFFSRKKNRMDNKPGGPIANGQDQLAENTQKDYIPAHEIISSQARPIQIKSEKLPQNCLSHSRSSHFETFSESSTFSNELENTRVPEVIDEAVFTTQHLVNEDLGSAIGVLEGESTSQETLVLQPSECSDFGSTHELYSAAKPMLNETENVMYEDVEIVPVVIQHPEDRSLKTGCVPAVEFEVADQIDKVAVLEEKAVSPSENQELSIRRDAKTIVLKDAEVESQMFIVEGKADEASVHTEILPQSEEMNNASTRKAMTHSTKCAEMVSVVSIGKSLEEMVECIHFTKTVSTDHVGHADVISEKVVQCSDFSEIAQIASLEEKAVQPIDCSEIASPGDAAHLLNEANAVELTEFSGNVSHKFDPIVLHQNTFEPIEATEIVPANCAAYTGLLEEKAVQLTQYDTISVDTVAPTIIEEKADQTPIVTHRISLEAGMHPTPLEEKSVQATEINKTASASKDSHMEEKAVPCMKCKEMDSADKVTPAVFYEKAVEATELNAIGHTEDVTKCAATVDQDIQLGGQTEMICTDVGNALILKDVQLTKFTDLSAEQVPQMFFLEENHPIELTNMVSPAVATCSDTFEENVIPHSESPITVSKDAPIAAVEEKMVSTIECSTIEYAENIAQNDFGKNLSAGKEAQMSAVDAEINFNESIVVGMLLNSYVESAPSLREDNECESTTFSQCLGKDQYLEGSETGVDNLQKAKENDFAKREAEAIEQMAMKIVSQVILSATREIMSGTVVNMSGISCHFLESQVGGSLGLENGISFPSPISGVLNVVESNRQNTIVNTLTTVDFSLLAEENHGNGASSGNTSKHLPLMNSNQATVEENKPKSALHKDCHEPNVSVVPNLGESFEETILTAEDSGCSACTSEDGVIVENPLHSTALSSMSTASHFDALNTSGIDPSTEQSVPSSQTPVSSKLQDNTNVPYSNGELNRNSPDLRHERHWSTETEADHSGGSDVNSMDSVDSGCALGKTGSTQDVKPGLDSKKSDLIIWEIEVPKHLVGRLIGKQGRYVSFLKQTSGAKIYISTLPYTQEFQICHLEGSQLQVDKALSLIGKKFKELSLTNLYAPPPLTLPSLPMTSWLMLPDGVTVEVIVVNVVNAGHLFVQQHTHPTFHALRSLDQQMFLCYSQPGIPVLPTPVEVGVICAAPGNETSWWRAQVVSFCKESNEVEIRYVDYGGYDRVKVDILRQIRSDFVTLPFQGSEVLLDNVIPLPDENHFSSEADVTVNEMTRGTALLAQVTNYDTATGLPLIQLWSMLGDEVVSINRALVERGFAQWIDGY